MEKVDIDDIMRKNPHLDRQSLDALRKSLQELVSDAKRSYRLAPTGTHRVIIGEPDTIHEATKHKSYPGF